MSEGHGRRAIGPYAILALIVLLAAIAVWAADFERFNVQDAMAVVQAIGVVIGARFAVLNLQEIRRAAEAETEPLLHVTLREIQMNGSPGYAIEVHNLGRGGVVGATARCWSRCEFEAGSYTELGELQISLNTGAIAPNSSAEATLYQSVAEWAMQSDLLVEVTYDSVRHRRAKQLWHFTSENGKLALTPLPTPRLRPPSA